MTRERTIPTKYTDPQNVSKNDIILYAFDDTDLGSVTLSGRVCKVMTDPTTDELLFRVKSGAYVNVNTNQFAAIIERPTDES
jgi:hypothetical protein